MTRELAHIPAAESVREFLAGLFDYAGLFPPASLSLPDAMREYARHRAGPDRWMIGPFVCPVAKIPELDGFADLFSNAPPFLFSILGSRPVDSASLIERFENDVDDVMELQNRYAGRVRVDMMELSLDGEATESAAALESVLDRMESKLVSSPLPPKTVFLEVVRNTRFVDTLDLVVDVLAQRRGRAGNSRFGMKLRCGGIGPAMFPSTADIAAFLARVVAKDLLFKATAGLHHPVRRWSPAIGVTMHGFLNVFIAAVMCNVHGLTDVDLIPILEEETADAFAFSDDSIRWRHFSASVADVIRVRRNHASSIGSCSFDEPLDDLRTLRLLRFEDTIKSTTT